ncbi:hypothetical protein AB0F18_10055 [Streptomyces sp. NPDC029216]|uniref:hypothetical protein n=1 Tax=Streptomyces sp. NPDC029216 TaxID=3154701 RepID=UPI0033E2E5DB
MSTPSPAHAREVDFPEGTRLFREGGHADRFWIVRSGTVSLDAHVPGLRAAVIEHVRLLMDAGPRFGAALGHWAGQVLAHRLQAARIRLLDLYAPYGSGTYL